jgi:hypothetical protein
MPEPLRVGVIGLGPLWRRRYRPALRGLRDRFRVTVVCDQVHEHAAREARRLRCAAAGGPADLLRRPQVDALLLLDPQWYGLWPLGQAREVGKPILFYPPSSGAPADLADPTRQPDPNTAPALAALTLRLSPLAERLRELLRATLGPARLVLYSGAGADGPGLLDLIDWCGDLLGGAPRCVGETSAGGLTSLVLEYEGRAAQLTRYDAARACPRPRVEILAERGSAALRLPDLLTWTDATGRHAQRLRRAAPPERLLLERFHLAITQGRPAGPGPEDLERLLAGLRPGRAG